MNVQFIHGQPIIDIDEKFMGLSRDRNPDASWGQLRRTSLKTNKTKFIDISLPINANYKTILLEDLAYAYGNDTIKFRQKLIEFKLI